MWHDAKNNHPLPLLEKKEGSRTVLALMVSQVNGCAVATPLLI